MTLQNTSEGKKISAVINTIENCVCVSALKAVRDRGENRRCYGNLKKRKCAGYAVNFT